MRGRRRQSWANRELATLLARTLGVVTVLAASTALAATPGEAEPGGPSARLVPVETPAGPRQAVRVEGLAPGIYTLSLCGNEGRRASEDCDLPGSRGIEIRPGGRGDGDPADRPAGRLPVRGPHRRPVGRSELHRPDRAARRGLPLAGGAAAGSLRRRRSSTAPGGRRRGRAFRQALVMVELAGPARLRAGIGASPQRGGDHAPRRRRLGVGGKAR